MHKRLWRHFPIWGNQAMTEVVILLPGIMGSTLLKDGELIWPGSLSELLLPYDKLPQLMDPDLEVGDIIRSFSISSQYQSLIDALGNAGFTEKSGDFKPTLRVCPYDWRKDNRLAADRLVQVVKQVRADHGGDVIIHLLAHSMGGLVSRYFLESGRYSEDSCPGFNNIRRLITMGTPHRGAPLALCAALGQMGRLFLSAAQVKQLAGCYDFPSLYQLFPPPGEPFVWNNAGNQRLAPLKIYDEALSSALKLSSQNLESAASFYRDLNVGKKPDHVAYFCFAGTHQKTIYAALVGVDPLPAGGIQISRSLAGSVLDDAGDGTVPSWSASLDGFQKLAVGGEHGGLYKVPEVLSTLAEILGKKGYMGVSGEANLVRISVRDEVAPTGSRESVVLFMGDPGSVINMKLVLRKCSGADGKPLADGPAVVDSMPIAYSGAPIDSLALTVRVPDYAGIYEFDVEREGASIAESMPKLLVQSS